VTRVCHDDNSNWDLLVTFAAVWLSCVAGRFADVQVAGYLIDKGRASVHVTSNSGATALHYAARYGNLGEFHLFLSIFIYLLL